MTKKSKIIIIVLSLLVISLWRDTAAREMATKKSKIFIIGGTGSLGRYVVDASVKAGHVTVALVRLPTIQTNPEKAALVEKFKTWGVKIVYGDINIDRGTLVTTMKKVDVVISCIGGLQAADQVNITSAIKEAGNIKRFFPSEFAIDVDHVHQPVQPAASSFATKAKIRRTTEAEGIPYTYVVAYGFASRFIPNLAQLNATLPNITKVIAFGDGNSKITCSTEADIATYTIKAVNDPRTLNKSLHLRPPKNIISFNELFALYKKKTGKTLEKTYIPEDQLLRMITESQFPDNLLLAVCYSVSIKNDYGNYEPSYGVEASQLYPDVKYTTVEKILEQFI